MFKKRHVKGCSLHFNIVFNSSKAITYVSSKRRMNEEVMEYLCPVGGSSEKE